MNNDNQALDLLKQLLDVWVNDADGDQVADIMDRIRTFLDKVGADACCGDPGDCDCEPGYGAGV